MAKIIVKQSDFSGGAITPDLRGNVDSDLYRKSIETGTNVAVSLRGAAFRRNGTKYIAEVKDSSAEVKLIPYRVVGSDDYILEFGNLYMRVFSSAGQILESSLTITGITQANPGVITSTAHGIVDGAHVYIEGVVGMTELNNANVPYVVRVASQGNGQPEEDTFSLETLGGQAVDTTSYTSYTSGGTATVIYEVTTPYSATEALELQYAQDGTSLYLAHSAHNPRIVFSSGDASWTVSNISFASPPLVTDSLAGDTLVGTGVLSSVTGTDVTLDWTTSKISVVNSSFSWVQDSATKGTDSYPHMFYLQTAAGGDPGISKPAAVWFNSVKITESSYGDVKDPANAPAWAYGKENRSGFPSYDTIVVALAQSDMTETSIRTTSYQWEKVTSSFLNAWIVELSGGGDPSIAKPTRLTYGGTTFNYRNDDNPLYNGYWTYQNRGTSYPFSTPAIKGTYADPDTEAVDYIKVYHGDPDDQVDDFIQYGEDAFVDGDVGRIIRVGNGEAIITEVVDSVTLKLDVITDFDETVISSGTMQIFGTIGGQITVDNITEGGTVTVTGGRVPGEFGPAKAITSISQAVTPTIVTATDHGLSTGDSIYLDGMFGMTELRGVTATATKVNATSITIDIDTSGYTAYTSEGTLREVLDTVPIDYFRTTDVGKYILVNNGCIRITRYINGSTVSGDVKRSLDSFAASAVWTMNGDAWSQTNGYPKAVAMHDQRLIFANTTLQPQTIWMSAIGETSHFSAGGNANSPIETQLLDALNTISWMTSDRELLIGTPKGEFTISGSSGGGITPATQTQKFRSHYGSEAQQPFKIEAETVFVQQQGKKLLSYGFDFNSDTYRAQDLSLTIPHLTDTQIVESVIIRDPDTYVYAVLSDGTLLVGSFNAANIPLGWTQYTTAGEFERIADVNGTARDEVWLQVKRTVNGTTKRHIEKYVVQKGTTDTDIFMDDALTYSTPLTITGITAANPAVVTSAAHGLSNGDEVIIKDLVDPDYSQIDTSKTNMSDLNGQTFTVANQATNTFELTGKDTSAFNAYGSAGVAYLKVTALTGLDHLEGKTVQIKVDGAAHADKTVSSGAVTLDSAAGEVVVGLGYTSTLTTLPLEFNFGLGSMQHQRSRWVRPVLRLYNSSLPTLDGTSLPSYTNNFEIGTKNPLVSGYVEYGNLKWNFGTSLTLTMSDPFPMRLLSITGSVDGNIK